MARPVFRRVFFVFRSIPRQPPSPGGFFISGDLHDRTKICRRHHVSQPAGWLGAGKWRIELKYLPIRHRGHAFLALVDDKGNTVHELHGLGYSKHTGERMAIAEDGADLKGVDYESTPGRDLLDPKYERYMAPPTFPVKDAP